MKKIDNSTQVRLNAKRIHWQQQAMYSEMRLKNNMKYVSGNGGKIVMNEAMDKLTSKVPVAKSIVGWVAPNFNKPTPTKIKAYDQSETEALAQKEKSGIVKKAVALTGIVMPLVTSYVKKNAFSWGLKGVRSVVGLPFRGVKKRRRKKRR